MRLTRRRPPSRARSARAALALLAAASLPSAASAATRSFTVTDFDRVRLAGPYEVVLRVGPAVSARAEGDPAALDRARLDVEGGTLSISLDRTQSGWNDAPGRLRILVTTPMLRGAAITGAGSLAIDRASAQAMTLSVAGAGTLRLDALATDRLLLTLVGAGGVTIGGRAAVARLVVQGAGRVDGAKLVVADADLSLSGAGAITVGAGRTAKVAAQGGGDVTVLGTPTCTVRNEGTGTVACGRRP